MLIRVVTHFESPTVPIWPTDIFAFAIVLRLFLLFPLSLIASFLYIYTQEDNNET